MQGRHKPLLLTMLLGVLFSVWFNNFDWTTGFYWSYTLLLELPVLMSSWFELYDRMIFNFCTGQSYTCVHCWDIDILLQHPSIFHV